jgi:preprotein translocase SecE subunit
MSVAENPVTERPPRHPQQQLAISSAIGAVILLAGLAFVFASLPWGWDKLWDAVWVGSLKHDPNPFLSGALLVLLDLVVIGLLCWGAYRALQTYTQPGLRAGIVAFAIGIFATLWVGVWLGQVMETQFEENQAVGWAVLVIIMGLIQAGIWYLFLAAPAWNAILIAVEEQGWFHATPYKGNQGVRVRRGTIMGILAVGISGIITMISHRYFGSDRLGSNDWLWTIPYSASWYPEIPGAGVFVPLMFKVHLMMPILLGILLIWFAWRVVNIPAFADFLIATEAEMNKVSWTTQRRLVQDTIVVLTTVFLFTGFLFVVDIIWIKVLSAPGIEVLLLDPRAEEQKQQEKAQW